MLFFPCPSDLLRPVQSKPIGLLVVVVPQKKFDAVETLEVPSVVEGYDAVLSNYAEADRQAGSSCIAEQAPSNRIHRCTSLVCFVHTPPVRGCSWPDGRIRRDWVYCHTVLLSLMGSLVEFPIRKVVA